MMLEREIETAETWRARARQARRNLWAVSEANARLLEAYAKECEERARKLAGKGRKKRAAAQAVPGQLAHVRARPFAADEEECEAGEDGDGGFENHGKSPPQPCPGLRGMAAKRKAIDAGKDIKLC